MGRFSNYCRTRTGRRYNLKDPNTGINCPDLDTIHPNVLVCYRVLRPIRREMSVAFVVDVALQATSQFQTKMARLPSNSEAA